MIIHLEEKIKKIIEKAWYKKKIIKSLLFLSKIYYYISYLKKNINLKFLRYKAPIPIIIIGNITAGGTGKTPFTIHITSLLIKIGFKPGIISRGYKSTTKKNIYVKKGSNVNEVGDEAKLLKECKCPVIIGKNRKISIKSLIKNYNLDIIISDDGIQHYKIKRDLEIILIDGYRLFGNGSFIPIGPLRESILKLKKANIVITNEGNNSLSNFMIKFRYINVINIKNNIKKSLNYFKNKNIYAISGIGNSNKFFNSIKKNNINIIKTYKFSDHYKFTKKNLKFTKKIPILMTKKDAVKCNFNNKMLWYINIDIKINKNLVKYIYMLTYKKT